MSVRLPTERRRDEVVRAALDLLAELPLDRVTTRAIADRVGVTQPALFRHFTSRDELVLAVLAHTRGRLIELASGAMATDAPPLDRLGAVVRGVLELVRETPGVPRLLFQDGGATEGTLRGPLDALVDGQRALFAGLVREAVARGDVPEVDAEAAARLLLALVQGVVLQWQLAGRGRDLASEGEGLFAFWRAGLAAGRPAPAAAPSTKAGLVVLDVRSLVEAGEEPFGAILGAVERLAPEGRFVLVAPFRPAPLLRVLAGMGLRVDDRCAPDGAWIVEANRPEAPAPLDLRDLAAPEPLEQVLLASAGLGPGEHVLARLPRFPRLLLPHLAARGLAWTAFEAPEGDCLLCVTRPG